MYDDARRRSVSDPQGALTGFRAARDRLFVTHPESPLPASHRPAFTGLTYWPYDPALGRLPSSVNLVGVVGALSAFHLYRVLGYGAVLAAAPDSSRAAISAGV